MTTTDAQHTGERPDRSWLDRDSPWWVKLRRADVHIQEVSAGVEAFMRTEPWTVEVEPAKTQLEVTHRFRVHREPPTDLLAAIGDAVHNLRSALDAMTYGLAELNRGQLTDEQEKATEFPIFEDEVKFDTYLDRRIIKGQPETRRDLYGERGVAALRCVQPFALSSEAAAVGVEVNRTPSEDLTWDGPYRLNKLWNIDKHRRLPKLAWFFDLMYCPGDPVPWWLIDRWSVIADGVVLGKHWFASAQDVRPVEPVWVIRLRLAEDPAPFAGDVVRELRSWHRSLGNWVVPRAFFVATTGNPAPIMIPGGLPYSAGS